MTTHSADSYESPLEPTLPPMESFSLEGYSTRMLKLPESDRLRCFSQGARYLARL